MNVYIFDVDGVITDRNTQVNSKILHLLVTLIEKGNFIAFVTGRSLVRIQTEILIPIEKLVRNTNTLEHIYVACEFGGIHAEYENGVRLTRVEEKLKPSKEFEEQTKQIVDEFKDSTFFEDKQTLLTFTHKPHTPFELFKADQDKLIMRLETLLEKENLKDSFEVQRDAIATNLRHKNLNKSFATHEVLEWLDKKGVQPESYLVFGDAKSDLEMGYELSTQGKNFTFFYVGDRKDIEGVQCAFDITYTQKQFDQGTLEYLKTHSL